MSNHTQETMDHYLALAFQAVHKESTDDLRDCLQIGVDANSVDSHGKTLLVTATQYNKPLSAQILVSAGANVDTPEPETGLTPLHFAVRRKNFITAKLLMQKTGAIDHVSNFGVTPLQQAAYQGDAAMVSLLLKHGADAFTLSSMGQTAADIASTRQAMTSVPKEQQEFASTHALLIAHMADNAHKQPEQRFARMAVMLKKRQSVKYRL